MRRLICTALAVFFALLASTSCRGHPTAPQPSKLECRSGWTITLGGKDSTYTGC